MSNKGTAIDFLVTEKDHELLIQFKMVTYQNLQLLTDSDIMVDLAPWVATTAAFQNTLLLALGHRALRDLPRCTVLGSGEREGL